MRQLCTLAMLLSEFLVFWFGQRVLLIDMDARGVPRLGIGSDRCARFSTSPTQTEISIIIINLEAKSLLSLSNSPLLIYASLLAAATNVAQVWQT